MIGLDIFHATFWMANIYGISITSVSWCALLMDYVDFLIQMTSGSL